MRQYNNYENILRYKFYTIVLINIKLYNYTVKIEEVSCIINNIYIIYILYNMSLYNY